jgi:hypothetical protein
MNKRGSNGQNAPCHFASSTPSLALADDVRLSDIEPRFVCQACGRRGADVRPNFDWDKPGAVVMGY